ncbi:hypothetical protein MCOR02_008045 [Pyricularia oryzae]|nr:hypothetical protein MCOR02_008045 [Pyricularia oryzae]KAI6318179.1 hypothetical protein MCOR34_003704 [Pyricularia oryzae]KAI6453772.1 hypothetical protein MCOR17_009199 [Pyricularia oryzae]KAI6504893.1 hypothetical protein MCOR13_004600 [Pyricularia oryzae]KAI6563163.1 hypothetical protein MCOR04_009216 [Pyricularia oryzae]
MKAIRSISWRTSRPSQQQPLAGPQRALLLSRYVSTNPSPETNGDFAARLREEMLARPPTWIEERFLSPTRSQLLDLALADYLPADAIQDRLIGRKPSALPPGHHLVYFPPMLAESELLPDGTDPKHSPGQGFSRRLWAGGSLEFTHRVHSRPVSDPAPDSPPGSDSEPAREHKAVISADKLRLGSLRCACRESIADVTVRGQPGNEKVYVELLREYGYFHSVDLQRRETFRLSIIERRTLVFLRDEEVKMDVAKSQDQTTASSSDSNSGNNKKVRAPAPHKPDYGFELTPSRRLLFHFSALTHNAHLIHLDREYCRASEGHRDLLVHGPLSLVLMLTALRAAAKVVGPARGEKHIQSISYRNLAPLYVGETMRVCVRHTSNAATEYPATGTKRSTDSWEIWIEGPDGGMAVKASAVTMSGPKKYKANLKKNRAGDHENNVSPGNQEFA